MSGQERYSSFWTWGTRAVQAMSLFLLFCWGTLEAETPLEEAIHFYQDGKLTEARERFQELATEDPYGAEILYYLSILESDADKSLEYRQRFLSLYHLHPLADDVLYGIAQYNFALGYYLTAAKDYQRLLRDYPDSNLRVETLYWLASSKLAIGAADSARYYFGRLIDEYAGSPMAIWAQLGQVDADFIAQEFTTASSKCQTFLTAHPNSPLLPVALLRLAEIYDALGERAQATTVLQRLVNDFPTTYQGKQAQRQLTEWGGNEVKEQISEPRERAFAIQVGAFSKRDNARNLEEKLRSWGYQVNVVKSAGRHRTLYLVWVGSYPSREEALREGKALERDRGLPYQIVTR